MSTHAEPMVTLPVRIDDLLKDLARAASVHAAAYEAMNVQEKRYPKKPNGAVFVTVELEDEREVWKQEKAGYEAAYHAALVDFQAAAFRLAEAYRLLDIPF